MSDLETPRFPQPFLELLYFYSSYHEILNLLSIDRREQGSRAFWINQYSRIFVWRSISIDQANEFVQKYPKCCVVQRVTNGSMQKFVQGVRKIEYLSNIVSRKLGQCTKLTDLYFCGSFDGSMRNCVWPPNLKSLRFGSKFNRKIDNLHFPDTLESLVFDNHNIWTYFKINFSQNLTRLCIDVELPCSRRLLPNQLQYLIFRGLDDDARIDQSFWPSKLTHIALTVTPHTWLALPNSLEFLHIDNWKIWRALDFERVEWPDNLQTFSLHQCQAVDSAETIAEIFPESITVMLSGHRIWPLSDRRDPFLIFNTSQSQKPVPEQYQILIDANIQRIKTDKTEQVAKRRRL